MPSLPRPDAVLLDLDGTLVDTVETRIRAWLAVLEEVGVPATRTQVAPLIGADGRMVAREVAAAGSMPIHDDRAEAIDRRAGELYEALNTDLQPLPGARAFLETLDGAGIAWAIATSSRREQVAASVRVLALRRESLIVDGSHVEHAKPAPDLLLLGARQLDADPTRCWYVGDSTWDMRAAVAAGMLPIGVTAGAAVDAATLRSAGASRVVETLDELVQELTAE